MTPDDFMPLPEAATYGHTTVLAAEVIAALAPRSGGVYVDATLGGGGHTASILEAAPGAMVIGIDQDRRAIAAAGERLAHFGDAARLVHGKFSAIEEHLAAFGAPKVDGIIADLGVSSPQLTDPIRGMSFRTEGPLDMRMGESDETALELIERLSTDELADLIYQFGEERRSRRIARCIQHAVRHGELRTTLDLRRAVVRAVGPARVGGVDPATRTFQALRIAVNHEMEELTSLLELSPRVLGPGAVLAVISFHSLEDRQVKRAFLQREIWQRLTTKPVVPSRAETEQNPRSRSAKLRAARKVAS
ncbi:MAG TPA: 16S rRNA (cytosine(1402)-N(4))-methyltransferase RsmH [Polyangiaceae bacterium]|nr:16S rRNA (cytosine(1402)-N(4))-methyltransferase RsmH [Polyangiaceae bacterium]